LGFEGAVVVVVEDGSLDENSDEEPVRPRILPQLLALAAAEPKWLCTTADLNDLKPSDLVALGVRREPTVSVLKGMNKYKLVDEERFLAPGSVSEFLQNVKGGKVRPVYKSAMPPDYDGVNEYGLTELVGDTFMQIALNASQDVFVTFYAPWCGHCKAMAHAWDQLAKEVHRLGWRKHGVVIARMDATENECEEDVKETGFPKLVLYPAVRMDKKFKAKCVYKGSRELDLMLDFLRDNARRLKGVEDEDVPKKSFSMVQRELEKIKRKHHNSDL